MQKALNGERFARRIWVSAAALWLMPCGMLAAAPVEKVLHSFTDAADGGYPEGGLLLSDGVLYGTTREGGTKKDGTAFKLTPPAKGGTVWAEQVLHDFGATASDGIRPYSTLSRGGNGVFYGTTPYGGIHQCGVVFSLTPPASGKTVWQESILHSFCATNSDGSGPYGGVVQSGRYFYGTANSGGAGGEGGVFRLTAPASGTVWAEAIVHSFGSTTTDGVSPFAGIVFDGTNLIGTTTGGGLKGAGTVFSLTPPAAGKTVATEAAIYNFASKLHDGSYAYAGVVRGPSGVLYGTTRDGGTHNYGTIYSLTPPAKGKTVWTQTILHDFTNAADGGNPYSGLVIDGTGVLYGTTYSGGSQSSGVVYKLTPPAKGKTAWTETILHTFTGRADGGYPAAGLVRATTGTLYGTTLSGGAHNYGTVFEVVP
jgi:uncharacterized repeat protein (TIGR03803 family)